MASNFGQLKRDIFGCTYFVLADIVIDCERNGFFANITAKKFFGNICGNVTGKVFQEQIPGQGLTLIGNVDITENANVREDLTVCGNLYVDSISPKTANGDIFINGNLDFDKTTINQVCSNIIINSNTITSNIVTANTLNVDVVCANVQVQTRYLAAKDGEDIHVIGNLIMQDANVETKFVGTLCGNIETNQITEKEEGNGVTFIGNINVDDPWVVNARLCGNITTDFIGEKERSQGIVVDGDLKLTEGSTLIGNVCGNIETYQICEKVVDAGVLIKGNTTIEGGIILPKGFGTLANICCNPYNVRGTVHSPAGCVATIETLPETSDDMRVRIVNNYTTLSSVVLVNIKSHDGNGCPLIKTVNPTDGEIDIRIKGIDGNISGNMEFCYLVVC